MKCLVTAIDIPASPFVEDSGFYHGGSNVSITLSVLDWSGESVRKLHNLVGSKYPVEIVSSKKLIYMHKFENEFKEFMLEKYPEKVIKDLKFWTEEL